MKKKKKNLTLRSLWREILHHPGRYLAITAIVALGVGFFAGLRICSDDMVATASGYFDRQELFDFHLISSVGFDDEAIEELRADPAVSLAEGAYACDAVYLTEDGSGEVAKFHSVPSSINLPLVTAGRLPENEGECALDCRAFSEDCIGTVLTLSGTEEDWGETFTCGSFTVTGLCFSPLYLNYERGATNLFTGNVSCFIYLHPSAFASEAYTEAFVTLQGASEAFDDDYRDFADEHAQGIEALLDRVSFSRMIRATAGARLEIADGESLLDEARDALDKVKTEDIPKLKDGIAEAEDGVRQLQDGIAEAEAALANIGEAREEKHAAVLAQVAAALGIPADMIPADNPVLQAAFAEVDALLGSNETAIRETLGSMKASLAEAEDFLSGLQDTLTDAEEAAVEGEATIRERESELKNAIEALRKVEDVSNYVLDRYTNVGYACFENDAAIVEGVSRVFPVFFFLVAALVCATTMTRMIAEERTQIGTLKALGYSANRISAKYILYAGSAALIGSASGYALGTWLIPELIWKVYQIMYGPFSKLSHVSVPVLTTVSFAAAAVCSVGTAWITGRAVLAERPAELIRPKAPKAGKRIFLERVRFLWRRMSFLHKVSARNIVRYKNRLWMMILGIGGCCALLLTGAGVQDSISGIVNVQFGEVTHYDYAITVADPMTAAQRETFARETAAAAESILWLHESTAEVRTENGTKTAYLVVPEDTGELFGEMITMKHSGSLLPFPETGGVAVDAHLAEQLELSPGSVVTVTSGDVSAELKVASVFDNNVNSYLYLTQETYRAAFGTGAPMKTAYVAAPEGVDPYEGGALFLDREDVVNVTITQAVKDRIAGFLHNLNYIVLLVIVSAALLSFTVLYELTEINITERTREIATIKVLGFYRGETASYVFRENRVLTLLGALAGLPMGYFLHRFVISKIKVDMVYFVPRISLRTYFFALLLTFAFTSVVHIFMRRRIAGIPMAESLKSVE